MEFCFPLLAVLFASAHLLKMEICARVLIVMFLSHAFNKASVDVSQHRYALQICCVFCLAELCWLHQDGISKVIYPPHVQNIIILGWPHVAAPSSNHMNHLLALQKCSRCLSVCMLAVTFLGHAFSGVSPEPNYVRLLSHCKCSNFRGGKCVVKVWDPQAPVKGCVVGWQLNCGFLHAA